MSRIIAGSRRGHRITMPPSEVTRPTTDRVREALFSAVSSWAGTSARPAEDSLTGLAFCDLFAGSGAVGLEAASRGASPVLLVEGNRKTTMTTQKNVTSLRLGAKVLTARVEQVVSKRADVAFDVVFADPPYDLDAALVDGMVATAVRNGWVAEDGLVVLERSRRTAAVRWPTGFDGWSRQYGETTVYFGQRGSVGQPGQDPEPE